jgi:hypothetical protein
MDICSVVANTSVSTHSDIMNTLHISISKQMNTIQVELTSNPSQSINQHVAVAIILWSTWNVTLTYTF